ncbi:MAG: hypothetical protein JXQ83_06460 [Candidatus Glassbacteria bacterium]|nr:hypothetical protein [Candidatus Glassbacteria bacterium]
MENKGRHENTFYKAPDGGLSGRSRPWERAVLYAIAVATLYYFWRIATAFVPFLEGYAKYLRDFFQF